MKFSLENSRDLQDLIRKLSLGLTKLSIEDNIESFKVEDLTIASGATITIRNQLTFVPKQYIITSQEGNGLITKDKGLTDPSDPATNTIEWDVNNLYLKNNGSNTVTLTVIFMR